MLRHRPGPWDHNVLIKLPADKKSQFPKDSPRGPLSKIESQLFTAEFESVEEKNWKKTWKKYDTPTHGQTVEKKRNVLHNQRFYQEFLKDLCGIACWVDVGLPFYIFLRWRIIGVPGGPRVDTYGGNK